jgi:uncharacterized membrane protein YfcA
VDVFLLFLLVGFTAQLIDGALGMAYGVVSASMLLALGVPPANVSASVHASKVFTGAASAGSHAHHRNVSWPLFLPLAIGGVMGGVLGAYVLTALPGDAIKPYVVAYLALMGLVILWRAYRSNPDEPVVRFRHPAPLGLVGGFLDALGGGGWGPTVTSTLIGAGTPPRCAIGTSNTAEFFVAVAVSSAFLWALLTGRWEDPAELRNQAWAVAGLIVGGVSAAPLAAWLTRRLPMRQMTWIVGFLVLSLAAYQGAVIAGLFR